MLTRTAQVVLNTLTSWAKFVVMLAVMFLLTPQIINRLGDSDFGLWSLTFSVLGFFGLLDFGFATGVVKYVAEFRGRDDIERRNRMLSTLVVVYVLLALVAAIGVYVLSLTFNRTFSIPAPQQHKALMLLWILAARSVLLGLPLGLFRGILFGYQQIYVINIIQAVVTICYGFAAWTALERGSGLITLAWLNLAAMAVEHVIYVCLAFRYVQGLRLSWAYTDYSLFKQVASFSTFSFVVQVSALILLRTDPILVKLFLPLSAVAVYAVALKIAENAHLLLKQFINALSPMVAELWGRGDHIKIRFVLINCTKFAMASSILLCVAVWIYAKTALLLWVGPGFLAAAPVLWILMGAVLISIPQMTAAMVLTMTGHHKRTARAAIISACLNVLVSVLLVRSFGLIGIALGTFVAAIVVDIFVLVKTACKVFEVGYWRYARNAIMPALWPGIAQFILTYGIKTYFPPVHLGVLVVQAIPGVVLYGLLFWYFGVEQSEKQLVAEKLLRWRHRTMAV